MSLRYKVARKVRLKPLSRATRYKLLFVAVTAFLALVTVYCSNYLRQLATEMALSDASDIITTAVNSTIQSKMSEGDFGYDYFVTLEKDNNGNISAITTNMTRINHLSTEILKDVIKAADNGRLDIRIPVGNLLGSNLLLGKGPEIPVDIIMLTSSRTDYKNVLETASINQTKHQILLRVIVDVDVLVPWDTVSTQVECDVLIAETVIVGTVPDTYLNLEKYDGY